MTSLQLLRETRIPSGGIDDFDLVRHDGRLLVVCGDARGAVQSWDPGTGDWRYHPLDVSFADGSGGIGAVGHDVVLLGDPATGVWTSPADEPDEDDDPWIFEETGTRCLDTGVPSRSRARPTGASRCGT